MGGQNNLMPQQPQAPTATGSGINDMFSNPLLGLASGLISASQPSSTPQSIGGGLTRGFGLAADMARKNQLLELKKQEMKATRDKQIPFEGVAREAYDVQRLENQFGKDSPMVLNAKRAYEAKMQARDDLSQTRDRTITGLKTGERWLYSDDKKTILGKQREPTQKERDEYSGRGALNHVLPIINNASWAGGQGSITRFAKYASEYETNPEATKAIDDYLLADKLRTATTIKEAVTLGGGKQKAVFEKINNSLDASDIPKKIETLLKQFALPPSALQKANERFLNVINESTELGHRAVPPYVTEYFDKKREQEGSELKNESEDIGKGLVEITAEAQQLGISLNDIKDTAAKYNMSPRQVIDEIKKRGSRG